METPFQQEPAMNHRYLLVPLLLAALVPMSACETQPRYRDAEVRDRHHENRDRYREVRVVFSDRDAAYIRDYYAPRHPHGYPPGLAKKGKVPPGHAMKLRRGEPLPHDFRWREIPRELEQRLTRLPDGYVRVIVGADIGIMNVRTRVVVDLLEDIAD
jgi:hypothetical protein